MDNIDQILDCDSPADLDVDHAIFYSVFRTDAPCTMRNAGAALIREAGALIKATRPEITNFVTMSPIPDLSSHFAQAPDSETVMNFVQAKKDPVARFHRANGATVHRVIPNADNSAKRQAQSYGWMVNYRYTIGQQQ